MRKSHNYPKTPYTVGAVNALLPALALECREAREAAGRKPVHIAARVDMHPTSISRFEDAVGYPRDLDRVLDSYAAETGVSKFDLLRRAIARADGAAPVEHQAE